MGKLPKHRMARRRAKSHSSFGPQRGFRLTNANPPDEFLTSSQTDASVLAALELMKSGAAEEDAARHLSWRDFEQFCAYLFKAGGYTVENNVLLSHPRAQIDLVAVGPIFVISLDCKHWKRAPSRSRLEEIAEAQLRRSKLLRARLRDSGPIVSAIVTYSEPQERFVNGVAVVPVRTLGNFIQTVESYPDLLEVS